MSSFSKTRTMNMVGAIGWALVGVGLLVNKFDDQSAGVLAAIGLMYAILVGVPAGTASALSQGGSRALRRGMLWANWSLIGVWCVGFAAGIYLGRPLGMVLLGALFFILPEAINIRALRFLITTKGSQAAEVTQGSVAPL
jgi:hypothetical protein